MLGTPSCNQNGACMNRISHITGVVVLIFLALLVAEVHSVPQSSDLLATWAAGHYFSTGQFDLIYVAAQDVFTMQVHEEWTAQIRATTDYQGPVYPFLYPPIWAWAAGWVSDVPFAQIESVARVVNLGLLFGCIYLGWRITRPFLLLPAYAIVGGLLLGLTNVGVIAVFENQPQTLVSFLILLSLERVRAKSPGLAGAALALAAAIKLYPALFVLFFLATKQFRAAAAFAVIGGALGLLSIALAGWPLHADFLDNTRSVGSTALVLGPNYSIHSVLAQVFLSDDLTRVAASSSADVPRARSWLVAPYPAAWALLTIATPLLVTGLLARAFSRAGSERQFQQLWPAALLLVPITLPVSWAYYLIPALAMAPALIRARRPFVGIAALAVFCVALSAPVTRQLGYFGPMEQLMSAVGAVGAIALAAALLAGPRAGNQT